jgi:hypothetical protein
MAETEIGRVTHYFSRAGVAALQLSGTLRAGDTIHILGHSTDLVQPVQSLQIEHQTVAEGAPGQDVAVKVTEHVREHDIVYRVEGESPV